jgi:hypothetical protein
MHDPLVVAFEIRRPWPKRARYRDAKPVPEGKRAKPRWSWSLPYFTFAGKGWYFPGVITIWHKEPGGHDSGEVCKHQHREQDADGQWRYVFHHAWRFHIHHWKIQVQPLQAARRWLLTRCEWCGGPSRKGDLVNVSHQWDGERGPWWRGERGLFHMDCSSVEHAHKRCVCEFAALSNNDHGQCGRCGLFRAWGKSPDPDAPTRLLKSLPFRSRIPADLKPELEDLWRQARAEKADTR